MSAQTLPKYKVAIDCLVYNHEPYLRDCLEGFVMQQTDFPFVAIVHDDASTDHSAEIIREYAAKYPDIIHPIYETENQWRKADGSLTKIMDAAIDATGAKYVAICEGDDYWTDPLKLQKQVDFLEEHSDYSMCFSNVEVKSHNPHDSRMYEHLQSKEYSAIEILERWTIPTCSVMFRNKYKIAQHNNIIAGDIFLFLQLAEYGKIFCINEKMACYRRHEGGVSWIHDNPNALHLYKCLSRQYEYMCHFFKDGAVSEECRKVAINNCKYVIYAEASSLKSRTECIFRNFRLENLSIMNTLSVLYTYVLKPLFHLR